MEEWKKNLSEAVAAMTRDDRPIGKPHIKHGMLSGYWMFNKTGRYSVTVARNGKKCRELKVVVFDCFAKEAFDYLLETCDLKPQWFYLFDEHLVLVDVDPSGNQPSLHFFELNHKLHNARLLYIRNFAGVRMERSRDVSVKPINPVWYKNEAHIPLFLESTMYLLPADAHSKLPFASYQLHFPCTGQVDTVLGENGTYSPLLIPMSNGGTIYFIKMLTIPGYEAFRMDRFIQLDLNKLYEGDGRTAISEVPMTGVNESWFIFHVGKLVIGSQLQLKSMDLLVTFNIFDTLEKRWKRTFFLEPEKRQFTKLEPKLTSGSRLPVDSLHPSGEMVRIAYEGITEDQTKLSMTSVMKLPISAVPSLEILAKKKILIGAKLTNAFIKKYSTALDRLLSF